MYFQNLFVLLVLWEKFFVYMFVYMIVNQSQELTQEKFGEYMYRVSIASGIFQKEGIFYRK